MNTPVQTIERHEEKQAVTKLNRSDHLRLLVELLGYLQTNPDRPEGKKMVDILADKRFAKYDKIFLRDLLAGLAEGNLVFIPPQRNTRDTIYITTREGRLVRESLKAAMRVAAK